MTPINIVLFAEHSRKLPKHYLHPIKQKNNIENWKIFFSHLIDLNLSIMCTFIFSKTTAIHFEAFLLDLNTNSIGSISFFLFPFMLLNYFFFSYFFNHGQTYGMHLTKKRLDLKVNSFSESFHWAAQSMIFCLSFGLSYFWQKPNWSTCRDHDYLYADLVAYKESSPINLLEKIHEFENEKILEKNDWKIAA